jgi:hypothetical protein
VAERQLDYAVLSPIVAGVVDGVLDAHRPI